MSDLESAVAAPPFGSIPAASVIAEFLRVHASDPQLTPLGRLFGLSPLSPDSRSWYLGALGEIKVARRLEVLGPEWCVLHSVPVGIRGSDIDHLVIGPAGALTINTKFHDDAKVWVGARRLLVNGQKTDHLRNSRYEATRVARILTERSGVDVPTHAAIVIVGASNVTVAQQPDDVAVLRDSQLHRWITRQKPVLTDEALRSIRAAVVDSSTWGAVAYKQPDLLQFHEIRRGVGAAKRTRIVWALGTTTILLASAPWIFSLIFG